MNNINKPNHKTLSNTLTPKGSAHMKSTHTYRACTQTLIALQKQFPGLFLRGKQAKPLKVGILEDIVKLALNASKTHLRHVLSRYTSSVDYLKALLDEEHRYNLKAEPCGTITCEQKQIARKKLNHQLQKQSDQPQKQSSVQGNDGINES